MTSSYVRAGTGGVRLDGKITDPDCPASIAYNARHLKFSWGMMFTTSHNPAPYSPASKYIPDYALACHSRITDDTIGKQLKVQMMHCQRTAS